jgi:hypothetical protein
VFSPLFAAVLVVEVEKVESLQIGDDERVWEGDVRVEAERGEDEAFEA